MNHKIYSTNCKTNAQVHLNELNKRRSDIILFATVHLNIPQEQTTKNTMRDSLSNLKSRFFKIGPNFTSKPEYLLELLFGVNCTFIFFFLAKTLLIKMAN